MACSKYEYVKKFENSQILLQNTYLVVRLDGKGFSKFTDTHNFIKPNDKRGLDLMNRCAQKVIETFSDIILAYGQSDEYSFAFKKQTNIYQRRADKIITTLSSCFSASYVFFFKEYFGTEILDVPIFDGRIVMYPSLKNLKDYFAWRQVDCHINNLYNTCFWKLVEDGKQTHQEAEQTLKVTNSGQKNELLFSKFNINYNNELDQFRKGTIVCKIGAEEILEDIAETKKIKNKIVFLFQDLIQQEFWLKFFPDLETEN